MSIRIRIAKWLAPELPGQIDILLKAIRDSQDARTVTVNKNIRLLHAILKIRALRTPKCSHVVKKACDIADAALSHPSIPTQEAE